MRFTLTWLMSAILVLGLALGCSTAPKSEEGKTELKDEAAESIKLIQARDPSLKKFFDTAAGYAVFPSVGKAAIGVGGAWGRGVLYEKGQPVGYCELTQASIGLQLGGQAYSEIIFFETDRHLQDFKSGNFAFSAQATAVALKSGAGANAKYSDGVAVFTFGEAGLMYEASIGGQKFNFKPF